MKKTLKIIGIILGLVVLSGIAGYIWFSQNYMIEQVNKDKSLHFTLTGDKTLDSIGRGVEFLTSTQSDSGAFISGSLSPSVEFTALALQAVSNLPEKFLIKQPPEYRSKLAAVISLGLNYIKNNGLKADGGIYTKLPGFNFGVYGTAVSLMAMRDLGINETDPLIVSAQKYLLNAQHKEKGLYKNGFGYNDSSRPDLSNTVNALEALRASGLPADDPALKAAVSFIENCQNRSESNKSGIPLTDDGGFFYKPDTSLSRADAKLLDGRKAYASYGAMSYAGLVSFLYADVDKNDPRVQSAWKWIQNNYDLDSNVNRGQMGLFYYYRIMAKALNEYGQKTIMTKDGKSHDWAQELSAKLIEAQRADGSWQNGNSAFLEDSKVMVTSFVISILKICYSAK